MQDSVDFFKVEPGDLLARCARTNWDRDPVWVKWRVLRTTKTQVLLEASYGGKRRIRKSDGAEVGSREGVAYWYEWGQQHEEDNLAAKRHQEAKNLIHEFSSRTSRPIPRDVVDALLDLKPRLMELLDQIPSHSKHY